MMITSMVNRWARIQNDKILQQSYTYRLQIYCFIHVIVGKSCDFIRLFTVAIIKEKTYNSYRKGQELVSKSIFGNFDYF